MPMRAPWEPDFAVGHDVIDAQHRGLLAQCDQLAEHCLSSADASRDARFDQAFEQLKALARQHFETEADLLARSSALDLEDLQVECAEFDELLAEIVTTDNFDRLELQRFLTLWWMGHIQGWVQRQRALLAAGSPPTEGPADARARGG